MGSQPLVSVIIPTYNAERWIRETLESALAQTYPSVEVIAVDDFSKDGTRTILSSFGNRIRVLENTENQGVSASRNKAIEASRGSYVAFLDHDDLWHPNKLAKQMALFDRNIALGLIYSDAFYQTSAPKRWRSFQINRPFRGNAFEPLLLQNFILCLTAVIPRCVLNLVGPFRSDFHTGEDYDLFLRIAERFAIDYVDEPLATYRIHNQNFSRHLNVRYGEWLQVLDQYATRSGVRGMKAMVYIHWGRDLWRSESAKITGFLRILHGLFAGLKDPKGFYIAFREAWRQKQCAQALKT